MTRYSGLAHVQIAINNEIIHGEETPSESILSFVRSEVNSNDFKFDHFHHYFAKGGANELILKRQMNVG